MTILKSLKVHKHIILIALIGFAVGIVVGTSFPDGRYMKKDSWSRDKGHNIHKMEDGSNMEGETHEMSMRSMMDQMSAGLKGKTGDAFDKAFLEEMIPHHEGAVVMAKQVLATSKRPELIKLANDIIAAQNKEILMMNTWLTSWFSSTQTQKPTSDEMIACTMDAKICPDGSAVGRQGPHCEFAPCPLN